MKRSVLGMIVAMALVQPATALGPTGVIVLVNKNDPVSLAVANHYRLKRQIPDHHFVFLDYRGKSVCSWTEFEQAIYHPVLGYLRGKNLDGDITVWITTPGLPHRVGDNGVSGVIHFGGEQRTVSLPNLGPAGFQQNNAYFDRLFAVTPPVRLHMHLDAGSLEETRKLIDRSVQADGTDPAGKIYLFDGDGPRASRKGTIPFAMRLLEALGMDTVHLPSSQLRLANQVLGVYTGAVDFPVKENKFVPGALGDHLTSFGGAIENSHGQMLCTEFLRAGCSATYGTVVEPMSYPAKFPAANVHVFYAMGFSAVESYWLSVLWPQQGVFVGDPLTRPFGQKLGLAFDNLKEGQAISGELFVEATAVSEAPNAGIGRIELYLDDRKLTSVRPTGIPKGTRIDLTIGEQQFSHTTDADDRMQQIVLSLATQLSKAGFQCTGRGTSLLLFGTKRQDQPARIEAKSSSPLVYVTSVSHETIPGEQRGIAANWQLTGSAARGDQLKLELSKKDQPPTTLEYLVTESGPATQVVAQIAEAMQGRLGEGYRLLAVRREGSNAFASLAVVADANRIGDSPTARLSVTNTELSNLAIQNAGKAVALRDPSRLAYDFAWLRFGAGPRRLKLRFKLPTATLADGRHELRVVAQLGSDTQEEIARSLGVVVRNASPRLQIEPVSDRLRLMDGKKVIARAKFDGAPAGKVEFLLNGRSAGVVESEPFEVAVDPAEWGAGEHRLTARGESAGKSVWADNLIRLAIDP